VSTGDETLTYVKPGEADGEADGETDTKAETDPTPGQPAEETMVEIDGEEIPLDEAVERNREAIDNPANHGMLPLDKLTDIMGRIVDLEEEVDALYGMDGQQQQQIDELKEKVDHIARILPGVDGATWDHFDESEGESE
jgi:hypothetical protein